MRIMQVRKALVPPRAKRRLPAQISRADKIIVAGKIRHMVFTGIIPASGGEIAVLVIAGKARGIQIVLSRDQVVAILDNAGFKIIAQIKFLLIVADGKEMRKRIFVAVRTGPKDCCSQRAALSSRLPIFLFW